MQRQEKPTGQATPVRDSKGTSSAAANLAGDAFQRIDSLTSLRFFAAFAVFTHHFNGLSAGGGVWHIPALFPYSTMGGNGVTFFFVLSGFLLTWSHRSGRSLREHYWRRIGRIWPAHLVAGALVIWVFYRVGTEQTDWFSTLTSLFLVQTWFPHVTPVLPGNPVTWTLSVEVLFYALFPLAIRRVRGLRTRSLVLLSALGLVGMCAVQWGSDQWLSAGCASWVMRHPLVHLPQFFLGMTCALALQRGHRIPIRPVVAVLLLCVYTVAYTRGGEWIPTALRPQMDYSLRPTVAILSMLLIAACVQGEQAGRCRVLTRKPLVVLGAWSYAFYLVHQAVNQYIRLHWPHRMHDSDEAAIFLLGTAVLALAIAGALYTWVEEPAQRWWASHLPQSRRANPPLSRQKAHGKHPQLPCASAAKAASAGGES
ncbi:acyltransferase family protein [Streptomyces sp. NPDC018045]|uniref:acyltransferase family protein n=1 Tax=Streptomyces sp. NPDC018045 TaxID=3365037 RepID=UPI00378CFE16